MLVFIWQVIKAQAVGVFSRINNSTHASSIKQLRFHIKENIRENKKDHRFPDFLCFVQVVATLNIMVTSKATVREAGLLLKM